MMIITEFLRYISAVLFIPFVVLIVVAHRRCSLPPWISSATAGIVALAIWGLNILLNLVGVLAFDSFTRVLMGNVAIIVLATALMRIIWHYVFEREAPLTPEAAAALAEAAHARLVVLIDEVPPSVGDALVVVFEDQTKSVLRARHTELS